MPKYEVLSAELAEQIRKDKENGTLPPMAFSNASVVRRRTLAKDAATLWRPTFVHDIDKILHCP
ncbi:MAG: phosphohydrolase, partial [Clostridia bacterium]|nr:phosphohydrolase [Clostridia bacterium]